MRKGEFLVPLMGNGSRSARTWGGDWGVPPGSCSDPPVLYAKVRAQAILCVGVPRAAGGGSGASFSQQRKSHIVHLKLVLRLYDQQLDPVDYGFHTVHVLVVFCH